MAEPKTIMIVIVVGAIALILLRYIIKRGSKLTGLVSAKTAQTIEASELDTSDSSTSTSNFTYSIWIYVDDWNYRYGEPKVIFGRLSTDGTIRNPCPSVVLGPLKNNLAVSLAVYPGIDAGPDDEGVEKTHTCGMANIPLQRWTNILVSCYNRALDLYLDGKLVRTCILPGVAKIDANAPVLVTPAGGFAGWTAKFQYWAHASNPQDAWNVYRGGYSDNLFGTFFGDYSLELNVKNGSEVVNTVSI